MATQPEIEEVRANTDEPNDTNWSDTDLEELIDSDGVNGASSIIWRRKAASYAKLVDTSEAGASHAFSDLHKNALQMMERFELLAVSGSAVAGRAKVKVIDRE
jgi:hypothetical protein